MASTAVLVFQGHNRLVYRVTGDGETGGTVTIPNDGGPSPDLRTDVLAGPLRQIARARLDGLGTLPAGVALTQAQARALLLADGDAANVGNEKVARARCLLTTRNAPNAGNPFVDADVDGQGDPVVKVTVGTGNVVYLDIEFIGGIGTT